MSKDNRAKIIAELKVAYWMEMETVMSYIANSTNLDGVRAEEIKKALAADVQAELGHAQILARRIKTIGGTVPGGCTMWISMPRTISKCLAASGIDGETITQDDGSRRLVVQTPVATE